MFSPLNAGHIRAIGGFKQVVECNNNPQDCTNLENKGWPRDLDVRIHVPLVSHKADV